MMGKKFILHLTTVCIAIIVWVGCSQHPTPLPRGYFRIDFPAKKYQGLDSVFPYRFEYPKYAKIGKGSQNANEPNWTNLIFEGLNATLHLSYRALDGNLDEVMEDSRKLAYKHTVRAEAIGERFYSNAESKVYGLFYEIQGNAASPMQFALTDSSRHFLRGSLYFHAVPNKDSLAPVVAFIREDIVHLMETISWKD